MLIHEFIGHAEVIIDMIKRDSKYRVAGLIDDDSKAQKGRDKKVLSYHD